MICLPSITSSHAVLQFVLQMARDRPAHLIQARGGAEDMRRKCGIRSFLCGWTEKTWIPYRLSCYGTRGNSPACKRAGGGSVSIKERVTLVAGGQLAIISPSVRSTIKTLSISLFIELFDPRHTSTKSVHMCTITTLQICRILNHRLVEPSWGWGCIWRRHRRDAFIQKILFTRGLSGYLKLLISIYQHLLCISNG